LQATPQAGLQGEEKGETVMAIIEKPPAKVLRKAITIRLSEQIALELHQYATFLGGSLDYVVAEALKLVFRKDNQFREWLKQNPIGTARSTEVEAGTAGSVPASKTPLADTASTGIRATAQQSENARLTSPSRMAESEIVSGKHQLQDRVASWFSRNTD
jgi:hypothetical protein